jgi:hypothetical protein
LLKVKTCFFITSRYLRVLSEKIKLYQGDQIYLYVPLTTSSIRLTASGIFDRSDYTVLKKALSTDQFDKIITPRRLIYI